MSEDDAYESFSKSEQYKKKDDDTDTNHEEKDTDQYQDQANLVKLNNNNNTNNNNKGIQQRTSNKRKRLPKKIKIEIKEEEEEEEEEEEINNTENSIGRLLKSSKSSSSKYRNNNNNDDDKKQADDDHENYDEHEFDGPKRKRIKKNSLNITENTNATAAVVSTKNIPDKNNNYYKGNNYVEIKENNNDDDVQSCQDNMEVRFLVSSRDAGAIIGRGGSNITHLRQTYESSITVPDCLSPERVLTIVANVDKITKIVREILKFIDSTITLTSNSLRSGSGRFSGKSRKGSSITLDAAEKQRSLSSHNASNSLSEIRLLLHTSHAGGLIGKGGTRITQLREETKAGIKVYSECCPQSTERVCAITGPMDLVTNATALILNLIRTFPIKGPNQLYNPGNFDPFMSLRYGGFGETPPPPPPPPPPLPPPPAHPHHHHESSRTNSIFTPPPIPPPPPAQYHHPTPPIHHHPFSSTPNRHLSTLNGPPSNSLIDQTRSPPEFGASSPSFMASHWPTSSGRMAASFVRGAASATTSGTPSGADVFASTDDPFHWITDVKHYDASRFQNPLMKRDVSIIINPNGTAISTIKVNHKVVGAIIGRGGNRIKEIRIKTQADISIDQIKNSSSTGGSDSTRSITVKGFYNDVQAAVSMICNWYFLYLKSYIVHEFSNIQLMNWSLINDLSCIFARNVSADLED